MAKANALDLLYNKRKSAFEFNFDMLWAPPLLSLLTQNDIYELNKIAKSVKLSGKIDEKYNLIDMIMKNRGFVKLHAGTNRVVYRYLEDQRFVVKIAVDRVGLDDNPAEFRNQFLLKPFVTKVFEVSSCGTVAVVERVEAILSREEFMSVADSVFNLITKFLIGKYVLEDFGSHYFMNYGIRPGFGPVLLDYPYVYELDGNKLYCNAKPIPGRKDIICGGEIDYDDGFNNLICTKCGKTFNARDLSIKGKDKLIIVGGKKKMRVVVMRGNEVIKDNKQEMSTIIEQPRPKTGRDDIKDPGRRNTKPVYVVQGRSQNIKKKEDKPKESILNGELSANKIRSTDMKIGDSEVHFQPKYKAFDKNGEEKEGVNIILPDKEIKTKSELEAEKQEPDMITELNDSLDNNNDDYNDEDEYADYDQYLNNRQRSSKIKPQMKSSKKNKFNGF